MRYYLRSVMCLAIFVTFIWMAWGYPPARLSVPPSDIIFSHPLHADVECVVCHTGIETSTFAQDKNLPTMESCSQCHDVEDIDECRACHRNTEELKALPNPDRPILFTHKTHIAQGTACILCHRDINKSEEPSETLMLMPKMALCMDCHDGTKVDNQCALCHEQRITLIDIHPSGWLHLHADQSSIDHEWCIGCHKQEISCINCHRGYNLSGNIHNLNYIYTHGLDAKSKDKDCTRCHDNRLFCNKCHEQENRIPLLHSSLKWLSDHGRAARKDIENCASCHDSSDPTCSRSGCHSDFDGVRGTDSRIHSGRLNQFDDKGPWHSDDHYYCFKCHINTHIAGTGFCGYCHR